MAKTEYTIIFDYKQSMAQASELDRVAGRLKSNVANELDTIISTLKSSWEGQNADDYLAKCKQEKVKIENTINDIKNAASAVRRIAESVKAAELRALALARARAAAAKKS